MMQQLYAMFINNNRASFHLWRKENLVKHQKVSKYENGCRLRVCGSNLREDMTNRLMSLY